MGGNSYEWNLSTGKESVESPLAPARPPPSPTPYTPHWQQARALSESACWGCELSAVYIAGDSVYIAGDSVYIACVSASKRGSLPV